MVRNQAQEPRKKKRGETCGNSLSFQERLWRKFREIVRAETSGCDTGQD